MMPVRCASLFLFCAIAGAGCGSSPPPSGKGVVGSYNVMITGGSKDDSDVMTVTEGTNGSLLLTFEFGITTDAMGPNENGLRATVSGGSNVVPVVKLASQPAHVDQSSGFIDGNISGQGTLSTAGEVNLMLSFAPASGSPLMLTVTGSKL